MRLRDILTGRNAVDFEHESLREREIDGIDYKITNTFLDDLAPSAFAAQAFGSGIEYNQVIAKSIMDAKELFERDIPIYVQTEIGQLLKYQGEKDYISFGEIYEEGESSKVLSKVTTLDILKKMREDMQDKDIDTSNIAYFAHPGHAYRITEIGRKLGLNGGVFLPKEVTWPENDPQPWVRNPKDWKKREFMTRVHHWLLGWVPRD